MTVIAAEISKIGIYGKGTLGKALDVGGFSFPETRAE